LDALDLALGILLGCTEAKDGEVFGDEIVSREKDSRRSVYRLNGSEMDIQETDMIRGHVNKTGDREQMKSWARGIGQREVLALK
jgi:hypothetical protein